AVLHLVRSPQPGRGAVLLAVRHAAGHARAAAGRPHRDDVVPGSQQGRAVRGAAAQRGRCRRCQRPAARQRAAGRAAGPERRQPVPARHRRGDGRSASRQRDLPRRRHRLPPARGVPPRAGGLPRERRRQPERHLHQPRPDRRGAAPGRRRGPDRQVPAGVLLLRGLRSM
ncbi:MAG: FHA-domain-containing protein, partial [uncultured Nocardioidaceae bacterium]